MENSSFPTYGNIRSMLELWVIIAAVLVVTAGVACLGQLGWSCSTWTIAATVVWVLVSGLMALCLGIGNLISDRPGE